MAAGLAPWPPSGGRLTGRPVSGARTDPRETGRGLASVDASGSGAGSGRLSSQAGYPSEDGTSATVEPEAGCGSEGTTAGTSNRRSPALAQSSRGRAPAAAVTPCPNTVHTDSETACQRVGAGREMAISAVRSASWGNGGPVPRPLRGTPLPCRQQPLPGPYPMPNVQTLGARERKRPLRGYPPAYWNERRGGLARDASQGPAMSRPRGRVDVLC